MGSRGIPRSLAVLITVVALVPIALFAASASAQEPPAYCVLFTHIEDATPGGMLGSPQNEQNYLLYRSRLIDMGELAMSWGMQWTLQPDWKILQAALIYEDAALMATTNDKNFLRYLKEDLGAAIDPHSHEGFGYNYTDVAHLLDSLGVGATTVIGGHIWDPSLPEFSEWDRFRVPVAGERYPSALWRGDILMGSGTPNHVNDPLVSGVWRPRDRFNYFDHDSTANIAAVGQYKGTIEEIPELIELYRSGEVSAEYMLTSTYHIKPSTIISPNGMATIQDSVITPLLAMRDSGWVELTDFTSLVETWQTLFASRGFLYDPVASTGVESGGAELDATAPSVRCSPNPFASQTAIWYSLAQPAWVRLAIYDVTGREVALLVNEQRGAGEHAAQWDAAAMSSGAYFYRLHSGAAESDGTGAVTDALGSRTGKLLLIR